MAFTEELLFQDQIFSPWRKYFQKVHDIYNDGVQKALRLVELATQHNWTKEDLDTASRYRVS